MLTINVYVYSYDQKTLSFFFNLLEERFKKLKTVMFHQVRGPSFLPKKIKKLTLLKSPHTDKKSRDQLEVRLYALLFSVKIRNKTASLPYLLFVLGENSVLPNKKNGFSFKVTVNKKKKYYFNSSYGILNR
jgi:ribosomal protein S10